jgi:hypothetical protein
MGMAAALGALAAVVAIVACVLLATHAGGTELNGALVGTAIISAGFTAWALAKLRDVARTDEGWGGAFVLYAVAYSTLLLFLFVLAFSHPMD